MSGQDAFEGTLASLHDAMLDDAHWPAASALMDDLCGSTGNCLIYGVGNSTDDVRIFFAKSCWRGQQDEELMRRYLDEYHARDERVPRFRRLPDSRVILGTELYTEAELKTSATYNEFLRQTHKQNGVNVRLDGPKGGRIALEFGDRIDGEGWSFSQIEAIQRLLPHIRQFVRMRQALAEARALGASLAGLLDNTGVAIVQLNGDGRIVGMSDRARDLLIRGRGVYDEGGFLRARSPRDDAALRGLLARALPRSGVHGAGGSMVVKHPAGMPNLVLHVTPIRRRESDFPPLRVAVLVAIVGAGSAAGIDPAVVAECLDLTAAECEVALLLAEGKSVRDIAAASGRKASTVRWHLEQIFAKLDISRQADLVRLVLSLSGPPGPRR